ncbi:LuxR C-terminal-related transcriptional regulator [Paraburkholderia caffeinilytica]|uniref:LuxR C-terminal-related transcriptional regulator n=1 Tax=Paraburkholderia caffeinilytica TaxID=1761016 RepID=UPI003DA0D7F5
MKFQLTVLAFALALSGCADHTARERLGIEDATVLAKGIGASQDDAAGAVNRQWIDTYAPIVSDKTVSTYKSRIQEKLGLSSLAALIEFASLHRLID